MSKPAPSKPPAAPAIGERDTREDISLKATHDGRQRVDALGKLTHDGRQRLDEWGGGRLTQDGRQQLEASLQAEETCSSTICTSCKAVLKLASPMALGKLVKCPKCGQVVPVVAPEEVPPAAAAKRPAPAAPPEETETADYPSLPEQEVDAAEGIQAPGTLGKDSLARLAGAVAEKKKKSERPLPSKRVIVIAGAVCAVLVLSGLIFALTRGGGSSRPSFNVRATAAEVKPEDMTFAIKLKSYPPPGASVTRKELNEQKGFRRRTDGAKVLMEMPINQMYEAEYNEVILDSGTIQPKRFKRTYRRAVEKVGDRIRLQSFQERTVVFELVGDKYEAQVVGEPALPAEDLTGLARKISTHDQIAAFLPQGPVKPGDSWQINLAKFAQMIAGGGEVDLSNSTGEGSLAEVRERADGRLFGVIKLEMKLAVKNMMGLQFSPPATLDYKATLDTAIDGSTTMGTLATSGKLAGKGSVEIKGKRLLDEIALEFSGKQERSAEK